MSSLRQINTLESAYTSLRGRTFSPDEARRMREIADNIVSTADNGERLGMAGLQTPSSRLVAGLERLLEDFRRGV